MSNVARNLQNRLKNTFRGQLTTAGQLNNTFEASIPAGVDLETLLKPSFWWPCNREIRPMRDRIECVWEDGSRIVLLRCMGKDERGETMVFAVMQDVEFPAPEVPDGYELEYVSPATGWRVKRADGVQALRGGFATAMEAAVWLKGDIEPEPETPAAEAEDEDKPAGKGGGRNRKPAAAVEGAG